MSFDFDEGIVGVVHIKMTTLMGSEDCSNKFRTKVYVINNT